MTHGLIPCCCCLLHHDALRDALHDKCRLMDAHVIWLRDSPAITTAELLTGLNAAEKDECASFHHPARLRSFALSRRLLRHTLTSRLHLEEASIRLERAGNGRLQLASPKHWHISLSHAAGLVAVIVAAAPCGVDIEWTREINSERIAMRYFSAPERAWLRQHPETHLEDFFRLWTLKEAGVKALGVGLAHHLDTLAFDIADDTPRLRGGTEPMALWQHSQPDLVLAAAVKTTEPVNWQIDTLSVDGL